MGFSAPRCVLILNDVLDVHRQLGIARDASTDVLGALCLQTRKIYVHDTLDPDVSPWLEGRFHFTLAHEIGHWILHREVIHCSIEQLPLFEEAPVPPIICRRSDKALRIEVQANKFASYLLMPKSLMLAAWCELVERQSPQTPDTTRSAIRILGRRFQTSYQATRIRAEELGLLVPAVAQDLGI